MTDAVSPTTRESLPPVCMSARFGEGGGYGKFLVVKKISVPPPDPPLSQKFADLLTILKFADLRLPTPVFWSSHTYVPPGFVSANDNETAHVNEGG